MAGFPDSLVIDVQRLNGQRETATAPSTIRHFPIHSPAAAWSNAIPNYQTIPKPAIAPEAAWQAQFALEHQLPPRWKLNFSESYSKGRSVLRTVNINAPNLFPGSATATRSLRPAAGHK